MKYTFHPQKDTMQCGAACLAMITAYYKNPLDIDHISSLCGASNHGVSLLGLCNAAQEIGFNAIGIRTNIQKLKDLKLPCILHWNQNHFVVLNHINRKCTKFYISDPGEGKVILTKQQFSSHWESIRKGTESYGLALILHPTEKFFKLKDNTCTSKRNDSMRVLKKYLIQYRHQFYLILSGLIVGCILQLILPFLTQWIVDFGIKFKDLKLIWLLLIGELMIIFGSTATDFIRRWLLLHISMRLNITLVSDFFIKLLQLPMSFFETRLLGDLLQRINDHSRVQTFITSQILGMTIATLSFIVFGTVLLIYSTKIFCIFLSASLVYALWIVKFLSSRKKLDYELFAQQASNQNKTYQFITSIQEIKLQGCERRRRWEWEDTQADLFNTHLKALKLQQTQEAGCIFINQIKNILITVFTATAVIDGRITLGGMMAIQYIVGQLNSPIEQLMKFIYSLQDIKISFERINEIHGRKNEKSVQNQINQIVGHKGITLENVDFKYDKHSLSKTLDSISFKIPEGKITAIVGASGSGKTTIIKLLLGYFPVTDGTISISNHNIEQYDKRWWRSQCGVVMQDGIIFSESIARNIAIDDDEIDKEKLIDAAKIACIHEYIISLPMGYDTLIGRDGMNISVGQKQRILIARAVYKNPDYIFLDEATNSLDAKNERCIVDNLNRFYKGRTVVIVAHRLSTVRNADQIIVLEKGKVKESGTHIELLQNRGAYFSLIKNQLELGK